MTPDQARLYDILLPHRDNDVQPSIRELADAMRTTPSNIHRMLEALLAEGRVERLPGHIRCWRAIAKDPFAGFSDKDLASELSRRGYVGRIQRGEPHDANYHRFRLTGGEA
jgi:SOS-response transcriptional repressor LexA